MNIENYKPSKSVVDRFASCNFVIIAGPAAAGKDTLRDGLLSRFPDVYQNIVSSTTRQTRAEEIEGQTYHFLSVEQMEEKINSNDLLQVAFVHNQQISGTDAAELEKLKTNKIGLSILVVQTEQELYEINPNTRTIFLIPPSYEELLNRLEVERVTKSHEVKRRLEAAINEIKIALNTERYYCVVSDEKERTQELANDFLQKGIINQSENKNARSIMDKILENLRLSKVS